MKLFLLSGFLGSGKTTAIMNACLQLKDAGRKIGVITNDQGDRLVDTDFIKSFGLPVSDVTNGCFCCNYSELEREIQNHQKENFPEIIFAESVGSCTDIIATVLKPMEQFHPEMDVVLSVFADASVLLQKMSGGIETFDHEVSYIYENQLMEADLLIVNKTDLLSKEKKDRLSGLITGRFPGKKVLFQNSLDEKDIEEWIYNLEHFESGTERKSLQIDYEKYGVGESKLAWLDAELEIVTQNWNAVEIAVRLINKLYLSVSRRRLPIGHLKFLIQSGEWQRKISFTSLGEPAIRQTHSLMTANNVDLLVNSRIQAHPDLMEMIFKQAIEECVMENHCEVKQTKISSFQPGAPVPEYRM